MKVITERITNFKNLIICWHPFISKLFLYTIIQNSFLVCCLRSVWIILCVWRRNYRYVREHSQKEGHLRESGVNITRLSWAMWGREEEN